MRPSPRPEGSALLAVVVGLAAALALASTAGAARHASGRPHARPSRAASASLAPIPVRTLKLRDGVADLAADGESAAIRVGPGCVVSVWHPRTGKLVRVVARLVPGNLCNFVFQQSPLVYANGRVAWFNWGAA